MLVQLSAKNFDLTEAIKEHVEMVLHSRFDAYESFIVKAEVVCEAYHQPRGGQPCARVRLKLEMPGPDVIVEKEGDDLYELVNVVAGVAHEQIEKRKEKGEV